MNFKKQKYRKINTANNIIKHFLPNICLKLDKHLPHFCQASNNAVLAHYTADTSKKPAVATRALPE